MQINSLRGWRVAALIFFAGISILEFADTVNGVIGLLDFVTYASSGGITPGMDWQRIIGAILLSVAITLTAGATVYGLYARQMWSFRAGVVTGILLLLFGLFQIIGDSLTVGASTSEIVFTGILYGLLGLFSMWLVRRGSTEE